MIMSLDRLLAELPSLLEGLVVTLELTILTLLFGLVLALPVALARNHRSAALRWLAAGFVFLFRGPPVLALLFLLYYGVPQVAWIRESWAWFLLKDGFTCAVVAFSLNSAAYVAEILAGALRGVPQGEREAALAAGFSRWELFRLVILPHLARLALHNYGNEIVFVIKGTAIASLVTVVDLMGVANQIYARTYDPFTPLLAAAAFYFALVMLVTWAVHRLERHLTPELRVAPARESAAAARSAAG
jgi:His/Glu/Gln/Arg/opine family amino acid ABC transporter permease subunit